MNDVAQGDDAAADFARRAKAQFESGKTTIFASKADPRFAYCLYVPPRTATPPALVVVMHGTGRDFVGYRDAFSDFGRWNNCIILAPLFPVGVRGDGNRDGFKYMREGDIRYDDALLAIVDEIAERYGHDFGRFALFGYSGGGHFVHRFLMLHPDRLWAASIGASGSVTLLDPTRDWWVGTRNVADLFGIEIDTAAIAKVPVHMVVGAADLETWEITHRQGSQHWMPDANYAGATRPERLDALRRSFEAAGIAVRFDRIANMAHAGLQAVPHVQDFFAEILPRRLKS